jgi:hypothetical protein
MLPDELSVVAPTAVLEGRDLLHENPHRTAR